MRHTRSIRPAAAHDTVDGQSIGEHAMPQGMQSAIIPAKRAVEAVKVGFRGDNVQTMLQHHKLASA